MSFLSKFFAFYRRSSTITDLTILSSFFHFIFSNGFFVICDVFLQEIEPSNAECEKAMKMFVQITKTDEACAHFFLQDFNWQLQAIICRHFRKKKEWMHIFSNCLVFMPIES